MLASRKPLLSDKGAICAALRVVPGARKASFRTPGDLILVLRMSTARLATTHLTCPEHSCRAVVLICAALRRTCSEEARAQDGGKQRYDSHGCNGD